MAILRGYIVNRCDNNISRSRQCTLTNNNNNNNVIIKSRSTTYGNFPFFSLFFFFSSPGINWIRLGNVFEVRSHTHVIRTIAACDIRYILFGRQTLRNGRSLTQRNLVSSSNLLFFFFHSFFSLKNRCPISPGVGKPKGIFA